MRSDDPRWERVWALFDAALEVPAEQRLPWLEAQAVEAEIHAQLVSLLNAHESAAADPRFGEVPEAVPVLVAGARVGAWRIVRMIGRGGMGEVYEVVRADGGFQQRAALKLLTRLHTETDVRRFEREREILARLEHPGIARLLDGGMHEQRPYAVLEYVEGQGFAAQVAGLSIDAALRLMLQVCEAVAAAHRSFVVHRDLKPGNVLVTPEGRIKLLDFGIAKLTERTPAAAEATQVLALSPDYCAPEQLEGGAVTTATDVYALGVMLYEMLAGERPWPDTGAPVTRALTRLRLLEVPAPSQQAAPPHRARIRGDLDAIVLKALRPRPADRYPTVDALAEDLHRHLEGRPVLARAQARGYVIGRTLKRYRWWVGAAAALVLSLSLGLAGTMWQARQARLERDIARQEASRADVVRQYLIYMFRTAGEAEDPGKLTAREVLEAAARRIQIEFADQPARAADMMQALGELHFLMNDYAGGIPLLEQMLTLQGAALDAPTLARVRYDLGQMYLRAGRREQAEPLLREAQAVWAADPQYRSDLLRSRQLEAQLQRAAGDAAASIRTLETAADQVLEVFGPDHLETGVLYTNLGVQYFHAARYDDADRLLAQAWAVWERRGATRSGDALNTLNNWASVAVRRGELTQAEIRFRQALETRRALFGPSSALAALLSNYGKLLLQLDQPARARAMLEEAVALAREYAGERSPHRIAAMAGLADAHTALGALQAAEDLLVTADASAREAFGVAHPLRLSVRVSQARLALARGKPSQAERLIDEAEAGFRALGTAGQGPLQQLEGLRAQLPP